MAKMQTPLTAEQLVATNLAHFPNESSAYRKARNELLVEEIGLRRTSSELRPGAVRRHRVASHPRLGTRLSIRTGAFLQHVRRQGYSHGL